MRQGVAIFAAAAVVAGTLPFLRDHDDALIEGCQQLVGAGLQRYHDSSQGRRSISKVQALRGCWCTDQ